MYHQLAVSERTLALQTWPGSEKVRQNVNEYKGMEFT